MANSEDNLITVTCLECGHKETYTEDFLVEQDWELICTACDAVIDLNDEYGDEYDEEDENEE